jgi:hypothetical protein
MEHETELLEAESAATPETTSELEKAEALVRDADKLYGQSDEARGQILNLPTESGRTAVTGHGNELETLGNRRWNEIAELARQHPEIIDRLDPTHPRSKKKRDGLRSQV